MQVRWATVAPSASRARSGGANRGHQHGHQRLLALPASCCSERWTRVPTRWSS
jgi:hypothetical protein